MVDGLDRLRTKLTRKIPDRVRHHMKQSMAQYAGKVVASMESFAPEKSGALMNSIGWTWGDAPKGSLTVATLNGNNSDLKITIYAGDEEAFYARFVEFGTQAHSLATNASVSRGKRQGQGGMHPGAEAHPFFYVGWRLNKRRTKAAMRRAVKKGLLEGSK